MAKKPWDDILKSVVEASKKPAKKAAPAAAKKAAKPARSVPAALSSKPMTKAERSAANKAKNAAEQAARSAEAKAGYKVRKVENREKYIAKAEREVEERWATPLQINKAKAFFADQVDSMFSVSEATGRVLVKGSGARRKMLERKINQMKKYAKDNGYELKQSDIAGIVRSELKDVKRVNERANRNIEGFIGGLKGKSEKETVKIGARRALGKEKRGQRIRGEKTKPDYQVRQERERSKRLQELELRKQRDKDAKALARRVKPVDPDAPVRGPRKKKEVKETESSKRLRAAQEKNAKRSVVDPRIARMTPAQRKSFEREQAAMRERTRKTPQYRPKTQPWSPDTKLSRELEAEAAARAKRGGKGKTAAELGGRKWVRDKSGKLVPAKKK